MSPADPLDPFADFTAALHGRLEAGRATYADRSFERAPAELIAELEQEALDLAGWGFVLWVRLRALRSKAEELSASR